MRHLQRMGWALLLSALIASPAFAVAWSPTNTITTNGNTVSWTSTASGEDSGVLVCQGRCACINTHASTNITIYRATKSGTKQTGDYWKLPAVTNCSDVTLDQCSAAELIPGSYIFDADSAAAATAECVGEQMP